MAKTTEEEKDKIHSAIKLIEYLYHQGLIKRQVFLGILNEYNNRINTNDFQCCDYT